MKNHTLIDTHGHINMMVKKKFDIIMTPSEVESADAILSQAALHGVKTIINVGTSLPESMNCVTLAQRYPHVYAVVGIHPNDCTPTWKNDFKTIVEFVKKKRDHRIVGVGECGIDRHYPGYNLSRQQDAFRAHIELALEHNVALVVHSRDAYDETLTILEEYKQHTLRGVIHCFSYDQAFANHAIAQHFVLGIGGTVTYPKNTHLRSMVKEIDIAHIVLETDAPFLPPQQHRGQQNHPKHIATIASFIAELRGEPLSHIAQQTTRNAHKLFAITPIERKIKSN